MQGEPDTMQKAPYYEDVVAEVAAYLEARCNAAIKQGIVRERLVIDPGFGFGKTCEHNLLLLQHLDTLCAKKYPVLVGMSRKSMLGEITGRSAGQREAATVASTVIAAQKGAAIIRVHDVGQSKDALCLLSALNDR
jgi:dihydropteroate synthase